MKKKEIRKDQKNEFDKTILTNKTAKIKREDITRHMVNIHAKIKHIALREVKHDLQRAA